MLAYSTAIDRATTHVVIPDGREPEPESIMQNRKTKPVIAGLVPAIQRPTTHVVIPDGWQPGVTAERVKSAGSNTRPNLSLPGLSG